MEGMADYRDPTAYLMLISSTPELMKGKVVLKLNLNSVRKDGRNSVKRANDCAKSHLKMKAKRKM